MSGTGQQGRLDRDRSVAFDDRRVRWRQGPFIEAPGSPSLDRPVPGRYRGYLRGPPASATPPTGTRRAAPRTHPAHTGPRTSRCHSPSSGSWSASIALMWGEPSDTIAPTRRVTRESPALVRFSRGQDPCDDATGGMAHDQQRHAIRDLGGLEQRSSGSGGDGAATATDGQKPVGRPDPGDLHVPDAAREQSLAEPSVDRWRAEEAADDQNGRVRRGRHIPHGRPVRHGRRIRHGASGRRRRHGGHDRVVAA